MISLHSLGRCLLNVLVIAISVWLLLPTTLLFALGLFASLGGIVRYQQFSGAWEFNSAWAFFTALLLPPGAGLVAVWWLTFAFPFIKSIRSIPRIIWVGLLLGIAFAVLVFATGHPRLASEVSSMVSAKKTLLGTSDFGGGPLAASILIIAGIWLRQRYVEKRSTHPHSGE